MKLILLFVGAILAVSALMFSWADGALAATAISVERNLFNQNDRVYLWTDPDTGCQYISQYKTPLVPRHARDGKTHMGCGAPR